MVINPNQYGIVLVVDDNKSQCSLMQTLISRSGFMVESAYCGDEALDKIRRRKKESENGKGSSVSLVITDVIMPGMDGLTLAQRLRHDYPSVGIIFVSGDPASAASMPEHELLIKPYDSRQFIAAVRSIMERRLLLHESLGVSEKVVFLTSITAPLSERVKSLEDRQTKTETAVKDISLFSLVRRVRKHPAWVAVASVIGFSFTFGCYLLADDWHCIKEVPVIEAEVRSLRQDIKSDREDLRVLLRRGIPAPK